MKRFLLATAALALTSTLAASDCCGVYAGAEWLYMRPYSTNNLLYARTMDVVGENAPSADTANNKLRCVGPTFDSGVRVWLGYCGDCDFWSLRGSYTYFESNDSDSIRLPDNSNLPAGTEIMLYNTLGLYADRSGNLDPPAFAFLSANGSTHFRYNAADIEVLGYLPVCDPFMLRLVAGVRYAEVDHKLRAFYRDSVNPPTNPSMIEVQNRSYFAGVGPRFGFDAVWEAPCVPCLALRARLATSLLVSHKRGALDQVIMDEEEIEDLIYHEDFCNDYQLIPEVEAAIGLQGSWDCGCTRITVELGYRATHYVNALEIHRLTGSTQAAANPQGTEERLEVTKGWTSTSDVGFGGLYLGAQVGF